jgi:predicted neuraminidase
MRYEHVFGDVRNFSQCHAATLVRSEDGGLLVAWFGGTREGHRDTAIWAADRNPSARGEDGVWSAPRVIAKVRDEAHWNPVLFAIGPKDWILHFKVGMRIHDWSTWSQRSTDAGETWGPARELVPGDRGGRGAVKNKPIRLACGDWLAGASIESRKGWNAFIDRSADGIQGWQATRPFAIERRHRRGKGIIQPTLWQSSERDVHALARSTEGSLYRSDSADGGHSWSPARPTAIPNNNSGVDLVRLSSGLLALACNPVAGNWAARSPLSLLFSRDNGESWPERIDIESDPGEFSYPALVEGDGGLDLAFTWNRRRIAVAHLALEELPAM